MRRVWGGWQLLGKQGSVSLSSAGEMRVVEEEEELVQVVGGATTSGGGASATPGGSGGPGAYGSPYGGYGFSPIQGMINGVPYGVSM
jgi:hypothetical protein